MNQLDIQRFCIVLRNGVEFWVEPDQAEQIKQALIKISEHKFIKVNDELVNSADLTGVFSPATLEDYHHRQDKDWKCDFNKWHSKNEECDCAYRKRLGMS